MWDVLSGVAEMAGDVLSGAAKMAWDVFVRGDKNSMGCFVRGGKNGMGCCVRGGKKCHGMFCPGMFCPSFVFHCLLQGSSWAFWFQRRPWGLCLIPFTNFDDRLSWRSNIIPFFLIKPFKEEKDMQKLSTYMLLLLWSGCWHDYNSRAAMWLGNAP